MMRALYRLMLLAGPADVRRDLEVQLWEGFQLSRAIASRRRGPVGRGIATVRGFVDALTFAVASRWTSSATNPQPAASWSPSMFKHDLRGAVRLARHRPWFTAAIVVMLAFGIGATTAIFSVVQGVLLRPLAFPEPERLVQVWGSMPDRGWDTVSFTAANFWDMRDQNRTFEEFGAFHPASFSLTGFELPERLSGGEVSAGFFRSLGIRAVAGRLFEPGDDQRGPQERQALLSHGLWLRRFGGDPSVVGRSIMLDGRPYAVIGVLPAGTPWLSAADVFVPFTQRADADRGSFEYEVIGRMKRDVAFDTALADLRRVARDLEAKYPKSNTGLGITMEASRTWLASDDLRRTLWVLLGAVSLLLVIACVNVTNLLLAGASARVRETAVRTALGARRSDLVRERLVESLLLSVAGAGFALLLAAGMLSLLKSADPGGIPRLAEVGLNGWVFLWAAGAAVLVGVATGLVPALQAPVADVLPAMRHGQRGAVGDRRHSRLRGVFVGTEVALAAALLIGAGLLVRSLTAVLAVDRGFQTDHRLFVTVSVPEAYGENRLKQVGPAALERVQSLPEVISAATVSGRPLSRGSTGLGLGAADHPVAPGAAVPWATWRIVTPDYFKTIGLPLMAGRAFSSQDVIAKPWRVVLSQRAAELLWPRQNAIGKTAVLWVGQGDDKAEVIGVVGDMRERGLENAPTLAVYFPAGGIGSTSLNFVVHTRSAPEAVVPAIRSVISQLDPNLPVSNARTFDDVVTASVATRRFTMILLAAFAGLALALALAGVYGVLAYSVARRTGEIGVRLALGAAPGGVLRHVVAQGMRPVLVGLVLGLGATFWLSRLMASLLFSVQPFDLLTYLVVGSTLLFTALASSYLPARHVLRVDPATALRME